MFRPCIYWIGDSLSVLFFVNHFFYFVLNTCTCSVVKKFHMHVVIMRLYEWGKSLITMYQISHVETITLWNHKIFFFPELALVQFRTKFKIIINSFCKIPAGDLWEIRIRFHEHLWTSIFVGLVKILLSRILIFVANDSINTTLINTISYFNSVDQLYTKIH